MFHHLIMPLMQWMSVVIRKDNAFVTHVFRPLFTNDTQSPSEGVVDFDELVRRVDSHLFVGKTNMRPMVISPQRVSVSRVSGIPNKIGTYVYVGSSLFDMAAEFGAHEMCDYALFELVVTGENGMPRLSPWRNRWNFTKNLKTPHSFRWRGHDSATLVGVVFVPFKKDSLDDLRCECLSSEAPVIVGFDVGESTHDDTVPSDGLYWHNFYWTVVADGNPPVLTPGATITLPIKLAWIKGADCAGNTTLDVETDAGYIPKRRISVVDGKGAVEISALGLKTGDAIKLKFGVGSFTGISSIVIPVV